MKRKSKKTTFPPHHHSAICRPAWDFLFLLSSVASWGLLFVLLFSLVLTVRGLPSLADESFVPVGSDEASYFTTGNAFFSSSVVAILLISDLVARRCREKGKLRKGRVRGSKTCRRMRSPITAIFDEYGPILFRRAYRMDEDSFWKLLNLLETNMGIKRGRKRGATPNGPVCNSVRLAMALRYFAGGDPLDIAVVYKVSRDLVYKSAWLVVDAINKTK